MSYNSGAVSIDGGNRQGWFSTANTQGYQLSRTFDPVSSDTVYMSMLWARDTYAGSNYRVSLTDTVTFNRFLGWESSSGGVLARVREEDGSPSLLGAAVAQPPAFQVNLVVVKLSKLTPGASNPYNRIDLFFNPSTLTEPGTPDSSVNGFTFNTPPTAVGAVHIQEFSDNAVLDAWVDQIVVTDSWEEAVGIPEPATFGLLGLAGAIFALRRRRG